MKIMKIFIFEIAAFIWKLIIDDVKQLLIIN